MIVGALCICILNIGYQFLKNADKIQNEEQWTLDLEESNSENVNTSDAVLAVETNQPKESSTLNELSTYYCHICGEVLRPGVYSFAEGTRLEKVIEDAGGFTKDAACDYLNLAQVVKDGEKIYVPSRQETEQMEAGNLSQGTVLDVEQDGLVNLNTADAELLMTLPGIGEAKAESILSYRAEHNGFQKIEELMEIEGIKEGVFNKIKDLITI
ncbi:competence protein ComEA [Anaeromicropila populeti]|uniref:Competence protein ComEA n=1 Tax=Anaeromicropila populeti TaxID=37658 RepID=A0A1I6K4T4_9FIRM|nr:competence protein ComEA [Anaeromicropila populeti]